MMMMTNDPGPPDVADSQEPRPCRARDGEVGLTPGRLRALLSANQTIVGDLALPVVLQRIVEAARELGGARYAALGVIAEGGSLAQFVHVGMEPEMVQRIGRLPEGKGLLGVLITDPRPIRLRNFLADPRSAGLPPGHPPMNSFLGVPIRVRERVFGNLYLAESVGGAFTAEDEQIVQALAATAGAAIDNAHLYEAARTSQRWLKASAEITRRMLSADGELPLQLIITYALEIAAADLVAVLLPVGGSTDLRVEVAVGNGADALTGTRLPVDDPICGQVFTSGGPLRISNAGQRFSLSSGAGQPIDPVLVVPLQGSERVYGVLVAARRSGRAVFTADDLAMAAGFANQAAVAVELAEARAEQHRIAMLNERDRIAADLHDHVIQRIFAAGLSLQAVAASLGQDPAADRVLATVDGLDDTIRQIRTTIFQLGRITSNDPGRIRHCVLETAADARHALGFEPVVRFDGPIEAVVPLMIAEDIPAVVREALTNVARHAHSTSAEVTVRVAGGQLTLTVSDSGVGMQPNRRLSGLRNLQRRAERHGGTLTITHHRPAGTALCWTVPVGP
jgi:signal transduction histidine kinase